MCSSTLLSDGLCHKTDIRRFLAIATEALTFPSSFGGQPDETEENYARGSTLKGSSVLQRLLLFQRNKSTTTKPSFASVFEILIFSSIVAMIISALGLLIVSEQGAYVMAMVGQAVAWKIYWVGIVGLIFSVWSVLSNMISAVTWSIMSVLVVIFFNFMDDEFDVGPVCLLICHLHLDDPFK